MSKPLEMKIIVVGPSEAGKTSFIKRFVYNQYKEEREKTNQEDFVKKTITYKDRTINLFLWDTVGQEKFLSIGKSFYRGAHCVLIVYDVCNIKTYTETAREFFTEVKNNINDKETAIIIVANKCDSELEDSKRKVSKEMGEQLAKMNDYLYIETSAKDNINIENCINQVVDKYFYLNGEEGYKKLKTVKMKDLTTINKKKGCC